MAAESSVTVDLESLTLRSGEAAKLDVTLRPSPPVVGGEMLALRATAVPARVDISRTTSGFALRLRHHSDAEVRQLLKGQLAVGLYDDTHRILDGTGVQIAPVLDALHPEADEGAYGITWRRIGSSV